jgi:heme/copper-type cytochrome/quinol oxidase subunit 2
MAATHHARPVSSKPRQWLGLTMVLVAGLVLTGVGEETRQVERQFTIVAKDFAFEPPRMVVDVGDLVKITLVAEDMPHALTIDAYRLCKRAAPGHPAVIEFRADQRGTYVYYCSLTADSRCRGMKGELVVR